MKNNFELMQSSLIKPVYQVLKEKIENGELIPGQKIVQEKMALELGISRTPLVKALHLLEQELLVENLPRRGMYVRRLSEQDIIDAFECRYAIEMAAIRQAVERMTDIEVKKLENLFKPFINKKDIDEKKYQKADMLFHENIITGSKNKYLKKMIALTSIHTKTYQQGLVREPKETLPEHLEILEAFKNRDIVKTERSMSNHIVKTIHNLKSALAKKETNNQ